LRIAETRMKTDAPSSLEVILNENTGSESDIIILV
jgi:hypothetical protein